ncbi:CheY-like protein [Aspergillus ambiguus]|uniref:response regulator n=1 Tax=Aspergillus ambiguus TaxID=176160 RepID=UPI003CCD88D9
MHVLVAEDNDVNVKVITMLMDKKIMGPSNYTMVITGNGAEALTYLANPHNPRPDIFFLDMSMPVMGGPETLRCIRTQHPFVNNPYIQSIPIVMMLAHLMSGDRERWIQRGANDVLPKPMRAQHLHQMLLRWTKREIAPSQDGRFGPGYVRMRPVWGPIPLRKYQGPRSLL